MQDQDVFTRRVRRLPLTLPIRVYCRETDECQWMEKSRLIDVSHFGAGFTLTRPVDVGRLIQLMIPLPHQLRCFDHLEPMYTVWSLVRHASPISKVSADGSTLFRIGVGFVGKDPPLSYEQDPSVRYEPLPLPPGQKSMGRLGKLPAIRQRRETRLIIPLEVVVETLDHEGRPALQEHTVTETISSLGTCIPTSLDVEVGRIIKITSVRDPVSVYAAVRSRQVGCDGIAHLGVEFIGGRWPLDKD